MSFDREGDRVLEYEIGAGDNSSDLECPFDNEFYSTLSKDAIDG